MSDKTERGLRLLLAIVLGVPALAACGNSDRAAEAARAAREDSIRQLGAAAWSDGQLIAYVQVVSSTLVGDGPVVDRRARSRAVRAFGRRVTTEHRRLAAFADSLASRRSGEDAPPFVSDLLQLHENAMRQLAQGGTFDLAYVRSVSGALEDVATRLARGDSARHPGTVGQLLMRTRRTVEAQLKVARELEQVLGAARTGAQ